MKAYFQASPAVRFFLLVVSLNIWLGIWLTGFGVATLVALRPGGFPVVRGDLRPVPRLDSGALVVQGTLT